MNRVYRLVYNRALGQVQVASEIASRAAGGSTARSGGLPVRRALLATALALAGTAQAQTLPTGGSVVDGNATINASGSNMTITQSSNKALIAWADFSIGNGGTVRFDQSYGSSAVALNVVTGALGSQIDGALLANGQVFLINPNGILFGSSATVNVGGLVASTVPLTSDSGSDGDGDSIYEFSGNAASSAAVVNQGTLTAANGSVSLLGANVLNTGVISASTGIHLLAASRAVMFYHPGIGIQTAVLANSTSAVSNAVVNTGVLQAPSVNLQALAATGAQPGLINLAGTVIAQDISAGTGSLVITANGGILQSADVAADQVAVNTTGDYAQTGGQVTTGALQLQVAGDASLASDTNRISSLAGTVGGNLGLTNDAPLLQSGALDIGGTTDIDNGSQAITFTNYGNRFGGAVTVSAGDTVLATGRDLDIASAHTARLDTSIGGRLVVDDIVASANATLQAAGNVQLGRTSATGALTVTSNAGSISQTDAVSALHTGTFKAAGDITLTNAGNTFAGRLDLDGNQLSVTSAGALFLGNVDGTGLVVNAGGAISQGGGTALAIAGTTSLDSLSDIRLDNAGNAFGGLVSLSGTNVWIRAASPLAFSSIDATSVVASAPQLQLPAVVNTVGMQRYEGAVALVNDTRLVSGFGQIAFAGTVDGLYALAVEGATDTVFYGDVGGTAALASLDVSGNTRLGGSVTTSGAQAYRDAVVLLEDSRLTSTAGGTVTFGSTLDGPHSLAVYTGGSAAFNGDIGGTSALTGLGIRAGTLTSGGMLSVLGDLSLTTHAAGLTQSGAWDVGGSSTFDAAGDIVLTNAGNDFGGAVNLAGDSAAITDANALTLGTVALDGDLTASSTGALNLGHGNVAGNLVAASNGGSITEAAGGLQVAGTSELRAGSGAITLTDGGNHFTGAVTATGQGVRVRDSGDLTIAALDSGTNGLVNLFAGGALSLPSSAIDTGTADLTLVANGGALSTTGALRGGTVSLTGRDGINLGADLTSLGGTTLTSHGTITQTGGAILANGRATIDANGNVVNLTGAGNDFSNLVDLSGGATAIHDQNALTLGTLATASLTASSTGALNLGHGNVAGNLAAASNGGTVAQSGTLGVAGTSTINAGGGAVMLTNAGNDFHGTVNVLASQVALRDANALALGTITAGTTVSASAGDVTLAGAVRAGGDILVQAGGRFVNAYGADALLSTGGRWLVHLQSIAGGHQYNGLDSGNVALLDIADPFAVSAAGNRYLFAERPTLTLTTTDRAKVYGQVADVGDAYTVGGLLQGVASAYRGHGLGDALTGMPVASSTGSDATATVAGGPYAITLDPTSLTAQGYALQIANDGMLTVDQAGLVITASDAGKIYGQTAVLDGFTASGLVNGDRVDDLQLSSQGAAATANVGQYTITANGADGTGLANYDITYVDGTLTVGKAGLVITAADAGKTYGQTAALDGFSASGLVNGDAIASVELASNGAGATANVGGYAITATGADGTGLDNYDITYVDGTLTVGKAGLVITAADAGKTYGQTAALDGFSASGLVNGDRIDDVQLSSSGTAATANVGGYAITATGADGTGLDNYDITYVDGTLTVGKAGLVITAADAGKTYGQTAALDGFSASGLVNGDRVDDVQLSSSGTAATANVGGYAITATGADGTGLANYDITYVDGTLTVGKAGLVITAADAGKTYGQTAALDGFSASGLVNGDRVDDVQLSSSGTAATANVGGYAITATGADGTGLANYDITYVDGTLTVGKAGLVITAADAGKTYGQTAVLDGFSASGLVNGDRVDDVELSSTGTAATANVGNYTITANGADGNGLANYDITYVDGTLTVGKAGLVITAADAYQRVGQVVLLSGFTASGLVNGDTVDSVRLSSPGNLADAQPGSYAIDVADARGARLGNYEIAYAPGVLQVQGITAALADRIAREVAANRPPDGSIHAFDPRQLDPRQATQAMAGPAYRVEHGGIHARPPCTGVREDGALCMDRPLQ